MPVSISKIATSFKKEIENATTIDQHETVRRLINAVAYEFSEMSKFNFDQFRHDAGYFHTFEGPTKEAVAKTPSVAPGPRPGSSTLNAASTHGLYEDHYFTTRGWDFQWNSNLSLAFNYLKHLKVMFPKSKWDIIKGRKYHKIMRDQSVFCFVSNHPIGAGGNIYKAASINSPARDTMTGEPDVRYRVVNIGTYISLINSTDEFGSFLYNKKRRVRRIK